MKDINIAYLEALRKSNGLTNKEVSKALGKDYESYYRFKVKGRIKFNTQDLLSLIELYNLKQNDIMKLLNLNN